MILKLKADEVEEIRRALLSAYGGVIRELDQAGQAGGFDAAHKLCRRKWAIQAVLKQLDRPSGPACVLTLILPDRDRKTPINAAA
jgi:hypothetical protein